jgi:hypothetical protein
MKLSDKMIKILVRKLLTAKTCAREQDRGSTLRLRGCWCFRVALYSLICPTPLSPTSEARFRDDAPGNLDSDKNRMDEAWK